jgi:hypothetical protein
LAEVEAELIVMAVCPTMACPSKLTNEMPDNVPNGTYSLPNVKNAGTPRWNVLSKH